MRKILNTLTGFPAYDNIRIIEPLQRMLPYLKAQNILVQTHPLSHLTLEIAANYDKICIHGCFSVNLINVLRKVPFVLFVDDLMTELPSSNPARISDTQRKAFVWAFEHADSIVVTTQQLKDSFNYPDKTIVSPNLIDLEVVDNKSEDVAYVAGNSHYKDLEMLGELKTDRNVIFFSHTLPHKFASFNVNDIGNLIISPNKKNIGWIELQKNYGRYKTWMKNLPFGVGLCPLVDNTFNRCKSWFKVLEYTQKGAISVVSNIPPYSLIPDHCVVKVNEGDSWEDAIEYAFAHREEIYYNVTEWAFDNCTYNTNPSWLECYSKC